MGQKSEGIQAIDSRKCGTKKGPVTYLVQGGRVQFCHVNHLRARQWAVPANKT